MIDINNKGAPLLVIASVLCFFVQFISGIMTGWNNGKSKS